MISVNIQKKYRFNDRANHTAHIRSRSDPRPPCSRLLLHALPLAAQEKQAVYFWISEEAQTSFTFLPEEQEDIKILLEKSPVVQCAEEPETDAFKQENDVGRAMELFYTNKFEESESILEEVWDTVTGQEYTDVHAAALVTKCFVFRMLIFKMSDRKEDARRLALEAAKYISPTSISAMDISPDGIEFIEKALMHAPEKKHELDVTLPAEAQDCTLLINGIELPHPGKRIELLDGTHWISSKCSGKSGWKWKINPATFTRDSLHLDPETESQCDCSNLPVVTCKKMTEGIFKMGSNLTGYPLFNGYVVMKPSTRSGKKGVASSNLLGDTDIKPGSLGWSWRPLPRQQATKEEAAPEKTKGGRINKPSLILALSGIGAAGLSAGLMAWSHSLQKETHTIQDPWERAKVEKKHVSAKNASISLLAVAASLLITSLIYHVVFYKRHKEPKTEK